MTTNILLTLIAVLLAVRIIFIIRRKNSKQAKYRLGDIVRFTYSGIGSDYVSIGKIWKIHKYLLLEPSYSIYYNIGFGDGSSYFVTESDIIELIERTNENPSNPLEPKNK